MRINVSPNFGKPAIRVAVAILLASVASGCSSDVNRFSGGIFSSKTDNVTTNSIPRQDLTGQQTPRGSVHSRASVAVEADVSYEPVNTASAGASGVRASVSPVVERVELDTPDVSRASIGVKTPTIATPALSARVSGKPGWAVSANSPQIRMQSGDTIASLSRRYGVPEKELLAANGLKKGSAAASGQVIIIPTYGRSTKTQDGGSIVEAKIEVDQAADNNGSKVPLPTRAPNQEVAILPASTSREKAKAAKAENLAGNDAGASEGGDGSYVVKSGDSLARIAKLHKTSVDALKQANGMTTAQLRIGQKIKLSGHASPSSSEIARVDATPKVQTAKVEADTPPVATRTVDEAEITANVDDVAPQSTGIEKYRWPVRGAVVAAYGSNVEGERNTGIDIAVPEGTSVKAAENGVVIYSGSGLKELGNTVLIRHDDGTVTVYGNAASLNVTRGQKVQRGQTIASSGMSGGAKQPKLHFEVRKNASPVNPMTFLE